MFEKVSERNLDEWPGCERPGLSALEGKQVRLEPLSWLKHGAGLAQVLAGSKNADIWAYMPLGPFEGHHDFVKALKEAREMAGWQTMVILSASTSEVLGMASYMRIREVHGSAEVGCIALGYSLQRTTAATEAMYLMAHHVFSDLGYRRYEWKCNRENAASCRAAERLGFQFEGSFRQDMVVKGKNRDTNWYTILDSEWPLVKSALEAWLDEGNFDATGAQIQRLEAFRP